MDHRIQQANPHKTLCHIQTMAEKYKFSCDDDDHASLASNIHCIECRGGLAGMPTSAMPQAIMSLARGGGTSIGDAIPGHEGNPLKEMANEILRSAEAFQLDAGVFTSLIGHESAGFCKTARSGTDARGLGQITLSAFREVNDQLFRNDIGQGSPAAQTYFRGAAARLGISLETLEILSEGRKTPKERELVEVLQKEENWKLNLFYAAAYLKITLTRANTRMEVAEMNVSNQNAIIQRGINNYNGAGGDQEKNHYSETICQYEKVYNPGFVNINRLPGKTAACREDFSRNQCTELGGPTTNS